MSPARKGVLPDLELRIRPSIFNRLLSADQYPTIGAALWETVKNGWDSICRKWQKGVSDGYVGRVQVLRFGSTLVCLDNGEGVTAESLQRFCDAGFLDDEQQENTTAQKRIGRFAPFTYMRNRKASFFVISATSTESPVVLYVIDSSLLSNRVITQREISRQDSNMYGLRPNGSFTMVVVPNVIDEALDFVALEDDIKWRLPRRLSASGFEFFLGDVLVSAPPLANELVIEDQEAGISGYFEKVDLSRQDQKDVNSGGIFLCDALMGVRVAYFPKMPGKVPVPMGRPEIRGDIFVPGVILQQNTSRDGLKAEFLRSRAWKKIEEKMYFLFSEKLMNLLGSEGLFRQDAVSEMAKDVVRRMNAVWGKPKGKPPAGISPDGELDDVDQDDESGDDANATPPDEGGRGGGRGGRGRGPDKRPRQRPLCYKSKTYFLSQSTLRPDVVAELAPDGEVIYLNRKHVLFGTLRVSPRAMELHLLHGIFGAIETGNPDLQMDAQAHEAVVNAALMEFYQKDNKK